MLASDGPGGARAGAHHQRPRPRGLDQLWAGWRSEYISEVATKPERDACFLCDLQELPDEEAMILERTDVTFTLMKAGPVNVVRKYQKDLSDPQQVKARDFEVDIVQDMLFANYTGVPDKPVGEGAQWTVEDRVKSFGTEVVRYRLFQIAKVKGDTAEVHMMIRQYAVSESSDHTSSACTSVSGRQPPSSCALPPPTASSFKAFPSPGSARR